VYILLLLLFSCSLGIQGARATIILSGDSNIAHPLVGFPPSIPLDPGNQQFYTNVLQGGSKVVVLSHAFNTSTIVNNYYNNLAGVTSTIIAGTVTSAHLTGVDLFVAPLPDDAFTPSEITALSSFLAGGGSIFFTGDHSYFATGNAAVNNALSALGSGMSITSSSFDYGWWTASSSQIAADPFTAGVNTFTYAYPGMVSGGKTLLFGSGGQPFVTYEVTVVPIPTSILLLGIGLLRLIGFRKKFRNN
jgi:hypothetical protein